MAINYRFIFFAIFIFLFSGLDVNAQKENNSIICCFDSVLKQHTANYKCPTKIADGGNFAKRTFFIANMTAKSKMNVFILKNLNYPQWSDIIDWDSVRLYGLNTANDSYLIASAPVKRASGLETNIFKWLIVSLSTKHHFIVESLSDNAGFFYLFNNELRFELFDYSQQFLKERDYDNISLAISKYKVHHSTIKLLSTKNLICNCSK